MSQGGDWGAIISEVMAVQAPMGGVPGLPQTKTTRDIHCAKWSKTEHTMERRNDPTIPRRGWLEPPDTNAGGSFL